MRYKLLLFFTFWVFLTEGVCQLPTPLEQEADSVAIGDNDGTIEEDDAFYEKQQEKHQLEYQKAITEYQSENIKEQNFDKNSWQKATDGLDYTVKKKEEKPEPETTYQTKPQAAPFKISEGWITFLKWFFIIIAILIIAFLVLKFVNEGNVFGRQSRRVFAPSVVIDLDNIEENLQDAELDPIIRKAIEQKQFTLAIRLYYLAIIKELNMKGAIKWKKDKTNSAYIREMRPHRLLEPFKNITSIFERVWYGNSTIDENTFLAIQPTFQDVLKQARI